MYQPYPASGQRAEPLRRPAPGPVRTAVKLMYAGAAVSAVQLIIGLALIIVDVKAAARGRFWGVSVTASQDIILFLSIFFLSIFAPVELYELPEELAVGSFIKFTERNESDLTRRGEIDETQFKRAAV